MATPSVRPTGQAAAEVELLARLGLPASASPEDVDQLHQAVSEFLAAAPPEIRGWARAQVAALDTAYIHLTDPVGLEGSALMSPASPPSVVPGGPATPPARRGPAPAVAPVEPLADEADELDIEGEPSVEDLAALYAMVTPSAHDDMKPQSRPARPAATPVPAPARAAAMAPALQVAPAPAESTIWKKLFLGGLTAVLAVGLFVGINFVVNGSAVKADPNASQVAQAPASAPVVDEAKVAGLMAKIQANPEDVESLLALGNEFYNGGQFDVAATWFDKVTAIDPKNVQALLARGAVSFNLNDLANAESTWKKVVVIDPKNTEVHYDLGFLYLNQPTPNWTGVQAEWNKVIELDPGSDLAKTVQSHLDSLVMASMLPAGSPAASGAASPAASPAASAAPSPAASPAPSTQP